MRSEGGSTRGVFKDGEERGPARLGQGGEQGRPGPQGRGPGPAGVACEGSACTLRAPAWPSQRFPLAAALRTKRTNRGIRKKDRRRVS